MNAPPRPRTDAEDLHELAAALKQAAIRAEAKVHRPVPSIGESQPPYVVAGDLIRERQLRSATFPDIAGITGEPAWEVLLFVFIAEQDGVDVSIGELANWTRCPGTTMLRYLKHLEEVGLIARRHDHLDLRRVHIELTATSRALMGGYLARLGQGRR